MSEIGAWMLDIQLDIEQGLLSFNEIAKKYGISYSQVDQVAEDMCYSHLEEDMISFEEF